MNLVVVYWRRSHNRGLWVVPIQGVGGIRAVFHLRPISTLVDVLVEVLHGVDAAANLHIDVGIVFHQQCPVVGHHPAIVDTHAVGQLVHPSVASAVLWISVFRVQGGVTEGLGVSLRTLPVLHARTVVIQRATWPVNHEPRAGVPIFFSRNEVWAFHTFYVWKETIKCGKCIPLELCISLKLSVADRFQLEVESIPGGFNVTSCQSKTVRKGDDVGGYNV